MVQYSHYTTQNQFQIENCLSSLFNCSVNNRCIVYTIIYIDKNVKTNINDNTMNTCSHGFHNALLNNKNDPKLK